MSTAIVWIAHPTDVRSATLSRGRHILRDNPISYPEKDLQRGDWESPAITVTVAIPES
jgi:hypothetical protein